MRARTPGPVLCFGTYNVASHPRMAVLIEGLRARGHQVVEVNAPLRLNTAARVAMLRQPWRLPLLAGQLLTRWAALAWRGRWVARRLRPAAVLVGYLGHFDVRLARRLFPRTPVVLDHLIFAGDTARDRRVGAGWKVRALDRLDRGALRSADVVVLDTREHAGLVPAALAGRSVVVPVGASAAWFAARRFAPERPAGGPLRVVFFGLYTPLQGTPVIGQALAELVGTDVEVTMVGTGQDLAETRRHAAGNDRVTWLDWVPGKDLPALVAGHDVCLGIFGTGPKSLRVVPNKIYQGAAAGCAVVTGDTEPQRGALGDAALFVPPGDAAALAAVLRKLADDRDGLAALRQAAAERADARFTAEAVTAPLAERLGRPHAGRRPPPLAPNAALRFDVVSRLLAQVRPGSILEIGCGQGAAGARLARRAGGYLGVEPDPDSFAVARPRIEAAGGTVLNATHEGVPAERRYDLVCAFEVLEHLEDDAAALADWARLVRPGGHLLLSVPAGPQRFGAWDAMVGHFRRYTPEQLRALAWSAGLVESRVVAYNWPLGPLLDAARNRVASRRAAAASVAERTAASGRQLQPRRLAGAAVAAGVTPFRYLQRLAPSRGTGLVLLARRPS